MQKELKKILAKQHFDFLSVARIDFSRASYQSTEVSNRENVDKFKIYFDLASLTKPLTLGVCYLKFSEIFSDEMILLLNHRAGLPSGGRLSGNSWRETILSYEIKESPVCYSDYSALRLMLEIEKNSKKSIENLILDCWDQELCFWKELPKNTFSPPTGIRKGKEINKEVNDDNALVINQFTTHAGLFATIDGLAKTILNLDKKYSLLKFMQKKLEADKTNRFVAGWDRVVDLDKTLAGRGATLETFGHLGFTGTSIWIDCQKKAGTIILTNATQKYSYDRAGLNDLRKIIGIENVT